MRHSADLAYIDDETGATVNEHHPLEHQEPHIGILPNACCGHKPYSLGFQVRKNLMFHENLKSLSLALRRGVVMKALKNLSTMITASQKNKAILFESFVSFFLTHLT